VSAARRRSAAPGELLRPRLREPPPPPRLRVGEGEGAAPRRDEEALASW